MDLYQINLFFKLKLRFEVDGLNLLAKWKWNKEKALAICYTILSLWFYSILQRMYMNCSTESRYSLSIDPVQNSGQTPTPMQLQQFNLKYSQRKMKHIWNLTSYVAIFIDSNLISLDELISTISKQAGIHTYRWKISNSNLAMVKSIKLLLLFSHINFAFTLLLLYDIILF